MFLVSAGRSFPANSINQTKISANNRMKIEQRFYISIIQFSVSYQGSDKFIFSWIKEKVKIDLTRNVVDNLGNCTIILFWQRYLHKGSLKYSVAVPLKLFGTHCHDIAIVSLPLFSAKIQLTIFRTELKAALQSEICCILSPVGKIPWVYIWSYVFMENEPFHHLAFSEQFIPK